jgi:hypothetical protein
MKPVALSFVAVTLLGLSALCLAAAPLVLPDSYSWISHTTSEAGAQGVRGAWLARFGFLLFGFGVLTVCVRSWPTWGLKERFLFGTFGIFMLANAAFSHRPWLPDASYDATEDTLHSISATAIGFAFALGILSLGAWGGSRSDARRYFDLLAVTASIVLPFLMTLWPSHEGAVQRLMFAVAYLWFGAEAIHDPTKDHSL